MKKNYCFVVVFALPFLFCQQINSPAPPQDTDQPGYFSLTQLKGLNKSASVTVTDTNTINLGDLHSTTNYYFLLTNCGGHVITNINLSVSDSSFTIFPTSIDSLTVGLGTQTLVPIIKLTAIHGIGTQGWGIEPLMAQGIHQVNINITGMTKHNNIDTNTSLTAAATINALVMDVDVHAGSQVIDLRTGSTGGLVKGNFDGIDYVNARAYHDSTDSVITFVNRGNVNIKIKMENLTYVSDSASCSIDVGDSANLYLLDQGGAYIFRLDGNNTICDQTKLPLQNDGRVYFVFDY